MADVINHPDYLFEVSWEVCNMVGGIYTVISTKVPSIVKEFGDKYITIGPDVRKEAGVNPYFEEDPNLFADWKLEAIKDGLHIRIGRWQIPGKPIAILVDFTPLFAQKDQIFAELWEKNQLDSLTGGWGYVEPVMFGYATGKVIESFYEYKITSSDKIVAHFHEWMSGAGLLYLKNNVPQFGTVFTTHATVLGRSIAGNNLPLYNSMESYNVDAMIFQFGIRSQYSMEKLAAHNADVFTTVSQLTATECRNFIKREVDVITPNGFDDVFVPAKETFDERKQKARDKLFEVSNAFFNEVQSPDTCFAVCSGRYEFKNKGIDILIQALGILNQREDLNSPIIVFFTIPANVKEPDTELLLHLYQHKYDHAVTDRFTTHKIHDQEYDPILNALQQNNLHNHPTDKVKVVFVPSYLNGDDGIFNLNYYDLLIGFDVSVFPSYYEPWGYTPLESLIFHVPTITTTLAGFGRWMNDKYKGEKDGVVIIDRNDDNADFVIFQLTEKLAQFMNFDKERIEQLRSSAYDISRIALWLNLVEYYHQAYSMVLKKVDLRQDLFKDKQQRIAYAYQTIKQQAHAFPQWKKIMVRQIIPAKLQPLSDLSRNLWWCWNSDAEELFEYIHPRLWKKLEHNPMALLETLTIEQMAGLENDSDFINKLNQVYTRFNEYMSAEKTGPKIAYFSMEYGLHDNVKIFSGGLGMLAGDYLKEASDFNYNITGVGLLYRYGYFKQKMSIHGEQIAGYFPQKFTHLPIEPVRDQNGDWMKVYLALPGRNMEAKVWLLKVGRVNLYLMDTDLDVNEMRDRSVTHKLYGGDWENRLKQELLLGVGGIRLLKQLGLNADLYHCNEGHAAFIGVERLRYFINDDKMTYEQALELVRCSTLFTTHTPVPAGHDAFDEDMLRTYIPHYAQRLKISWDDFMGLGRLKVGNHDEKFSMSIPAARMSQEMNGVSEIHGRVSRDMFVNMYNGYFPNELNITHVTNGVHLPTWLSPEMHKLYRQYLSEDFIKNQSDNSMWEKIMDVPDEVIWNARNNHRHRLIDYVKVRIAEDLTRREENPKVILKTVESYNKEALTIGFARRFATYKRAHLLFTNLERFSEIVNNKDCPVQFIFAGKAHPADKAGQDLIKRIIEISKMPEFIGHITFIENYDMDLGKHLTQGVDIWLNTPTRPLEASGTSGEKAVMNGVMNFSVLDGWWAEGYFEGAGWAIKEARTYQNQEFQDELDAETIYTMLENEIIPMYYNKDENGVSQQWVSHIKNTIAGIAPNFTMRRMLKDYIHLFYEPMSERLNILKENSNKVANELAQWKRKFKQTWDQIEITAIKLPDSDNHPLSLGELFQAEIHVDSKGLDPADLGFEVLFGHKVNDEVKEVEAINQLTYKGRENGSEVYFCEIKIPKAGVYDFAFRMFPSNSRLPHRQDFHMVKWI
ncbi:MAG: alpha-glucan family phosphorylase [Bacteroidales bacterium]|nr:alpha-glucan family phosphorylase [Bacteroidales bacterium]